MRKKEKKNLEHEHALNIFGNKRMHVNNLAMKDNHSTTYLTHAHCIEPANVKRKSRTCISSHIA